MGEQGILKPQAHEDMATRVFLKSFLPEPSICNKCFMVGGLEQQVLWAPPSERGNFLPFVVCQACYHRQVLNFTSGFSAPVKQSEDFLHRL